MSRRWNSPALQVSTPPPQAPATPQVLPSLCFHQDSSPATSSGSSPIPQTPHQGHRTGSGWKQGNFPAWASPVATERCLRGGWGGIWPALGTGDHEQDGTLQSSEETVSTVEIALEFGSNDPVKLGTGRGNASTKASRRFPVFSLLITAKKAGPFPSHKSCGGVSPVCPPSAHVASQLCSHDGQNREKNRLAAPRSRGC